MAIKTLQNPIKIISGYLKILCILYVFLTAVDSSSSTVGAEEAELSSAGNSCTVTCDSSVDGELAAISGALRPAGISVDRVEVTCCVLPPFPAASNAEDRAALLLSSKNVSFTPLFCCRNGHAGERVLCHASSDEFLLRLDNSRLHQGHFTWLTSSVDGMCTNPAAVAAKQGTDKSSAPCWYVANLALSLRFLNCCVLCRLCSCCIDLVICVVALYCEG